MPFEKVDTQVDFPALERDVLALWQRYSTFDRLREQNRGKPKWSFLDGPITANNPMGVHHAWGRTYKDAYQRYFAMTGHELRYQNGFDCQGLWVEVEVEKELKLKSKRDIENLVPGDTFASIDDFVQRCKQRVDKFARKQTEQSIRLGYWMDWDRDEDWKKPAGERRSYFTMSEENNFTIWSFLRKCHDRGLVYKAYDAMPWCPRCGVGISQQEMHEGYFVVAHRALFVAFPLRGRPKENLLVWTTTPWTLTSNVAAAVNPELTYLKVRLRDQFYYVAEKAFTFHRLEEQFKGKKEWVEGVPKLKTLEQIFKEKAGKEGWEVVGKISGAEMVGWEYDGPFDELPAQGHPSGYPDEVARAAVRQGWASPRPARQVHRVIAWKDVGGEEGTGIVHIAPGCGKEDFALGKAEHLVAVGPLDESGVFLEGFGALTGKSAIDHTTTDWILEDLKKKGVLLEVERYPHNYPHCWRCKTELLFRLVDEWFIDMKWREEIVDVTNQVTFLPESINGKARENDWLKNMGDWMISKKRFWGLALPIWYCEDCMVFDVIGSREELKQRAVEGWEKFEGHTPHRPWIDLVKIRCPKCAKPISRIHDVGNPWLDAGIVPYSTMGYNRDRASWEKWFPADFITESFPGQFRNWFYAILAMSTMMEHRAPMKVLLGHGQVRDQWGDEMHKSKGNAIPFEGAADGEKKEGVGQPCYVIKHDLKSGDQTVVPGAISVDITEEDRGGKKVKVITAVCPPMSADLMRWMYSRQAPASNINFGPTPAEELHSKFRSKLWNSYRFFCDNARLPVETGGFDVRAPQVPVKDRPDFDRWILSDLHKLVQTAHETFPRFDVASFCQEAEAFIDDKLSNWWVRRNKDRFHASAPGKDKLAAYQTLHTVLVTLTKLFAPIIPFLSESIYRNLVDGPEDRSVHLCEFPKVDATLIDEELSRDMDALLRVKAVGSAARNTVKLKVRQPLAEMKVLPANEGQRRAVERFADLLTDELNIKKVTLHDPAKGPLLRLDFKPNPKNLGPKAGAKLKDVQAALTALPPAERESLATRLQKGESLEFAYPGGSLTLEPADVFISAVAPEPWAGTADGGTQVVIDTRVTEELKREGVAREVIRQGNDARKQAGLNIEDRIVLYLSTESATLREAIDAHRDYIAAETLVKQWADGPLDSGAYKADVKVDGQPLNIQLRKV